MLIPSTNFGHPSGTDDVTSLNNEMSGREQPSFREDQGPYILIYPLITELYIHAST